MKIFDRSFLVGLATGIVLGILIVIFGGYILIRSVAPKPGEGLEAMLQPPPLPVQTKMNYDWRVKGLDGNQLDVAETKGKVVFLNFWATWCPPCVAEIPSIQRLYDKIKGEEVVFLCVSGESESRVMEFVREKGLTLPVYTIVGEKPQVFMTRGIPATFIVSPDGQIVFKHVGIAKWDDQTTVAFIKELIRPNP